MLISLDPNQPAPEYSSTNPKPDVSEVRLILTQPGDYGSGGLARVH